MTRNMTLTGLLMLASVAAAVAAPELPADIAGCSVSSGHTMAIAPARLDEAAPRVVPVKGAEVEAPIGAASCDVTEPYRLLHHGSMKLAPACVTGESI